MDQRKEKDVQESLTKVSSFLWPKPKEMKEMANPAMKLTFGSGLETSFSEVETGWAEGS